MCFFQGWAGPGGVGPQIGAALGALVSFNLRYSNLAARSAKIFLKKFEPRWGLETHLKAGIETESKSKGPGQGIFKNAFRPNRGRRQRQRPNQGVYKNASKPGSGPKAKAKAKPGNL